MTQILIDIRRADAGGSLVNVTGEIEWYPSRRHNTDSEVVLPVGFVLPLSGSAVEIEVLPNTDEWCWAVIERTEGIHDDTSLYRRYVTVPDSSSQLNYNNLTDVSPEDFVPTLTPSTPLAGMIVTGEVVGDDLILTTYGGTNINAGAVVGPAGATGATGPAGDNGAAGLSAYEIAVNQGFEGTEQEWLDYLNGTAAIESHISDATPHPAYDDASSLNLLFENGLV